MVISFNTKSKSERYRMLYELSGKGSSISVDRMLSPLTGIPLFLLTASVQLLHLPAVHLATQAQG